jgi:hypothetical protein
MMTSEELRDGDRIERARQLFHVLRVALLGPEPADEPPLPAEEAGERLRVAPGVACYRERIPDCSHGRESARLCWRGLRQPERQ